MTGYFSKAVDLADAIFKEVYEHMSGQSRVMAQDHETGKLFYIKNVYTERHDDADGSLTTWVEIEEA